MSLMFPEYLSGGGRKPRKPNHDLPPELGMGPYPSEPTPQEKQKARRKANLFPERDEYGAELLREARVWKIYVKETDRADVELVDGWNKSLDVILVFAALFSAISTAFLIESSKKLQEDPADVTAQTLLAISQSLLPLANGSQPIATGPSQDNNEATFAPPRAMVTVNTLWYLSLSLSVATSLLAMLAKDWCHSFMAGRTGHPYDQTLRRQQKWMMIEKWKMQELIVVLPSMIHLSLLLFAIGLCIYVWELNSDVALPVVCVTGAALGFYLWSSFTASVVKYFPYTTVISRFLRSDWRKSLTGWLFNAFFSPWRTLSSAITELAGWCKLQCILVARGTSKALDWIWYSDALGWSEPLDRFLESWREPLSKWADRAAETLPIHLRKALSQHRDVFPTLALHWIITNCEVPSAVDAALQAISGANPQSYREPLEECNAALEIAKRLVSGNIYNSDDQHVVSLYIRSLQFLGSNRPPEAITQTDLGGTGELQVTIWNLQTQYDQQVAQLVADGDFTPNDQNIEALRIGSSIASYMMQVVNGSEQAEDSPLEPVLQLLEDHYVKKHPLHLASLKSLFNTFELLSIITTDCKMLLRLIHQLVILSPNSDLLPPDPTDSSDRTKEALRCAYILAQSLHQRVFDSTMTPDTSLSVFARKIIQHINGSRSMSRGELLLQTLTFILEVRDCRNLSSIGLSFNHAHSVMGQTGDFDSGIPWISGSDTQTLDRHFHRAIPDYIRTLYHENDGRSLMQSNLSSRVYLFVAEVMICTQSDDLKDRCRYMLAHLPFPKLSPDLVDVLEKHDLIPFLEQASASPDQQLQILAISLLWLLCALESYAPPDTDDIRDRLRTQLRRCTGWGEVREMKGALGNRLFVHHRGAWTERIYFQGFVARVLECVVEASDHVAPHSEDSTDNAVVELKEWIARYIPSPLNSSLRGLAAFTAYPNHPQPIAEQEVPQPEPDVRIDFPDHGTPEGSSS